MKLPNSEKIFIDIEKLSGYCLNSAHDRGKHKARLFSSILGVTLENAEELRKVLLEAARNHDAEIGREDRYGKRYVIDFTMATKKGQAKIRSTWIIRSNENFIRLTSCYIIKNKERKDE